MFRILPFMLWLATSAVADVDGVVRVIDGDTFEVGGQRVRLHGIDAPEQNQICEDENGAPWACGEFVTAEVRRRYEGRSVTCQQIDIDRYGRIVGKCFAGGQDIGEDIVLDGWATAYRQYSMDYDLAEKSAQVRGDGIWAGGLQAPAAFRAQRQPSPTTPAQGSCIIKGNISGSGRIYHMPHNRDYGRTRINEAQGERWFCTEADARAAGWRPARN